MIFGVLRDVGGIAHASALIEAFATTPQVVSGDQLTTRIASTTTEADGSFELELTQLATVQIRSTAACLDSIKVVPALDLQDIATWADA